ncbi:MAG TPA: hypothetical protein PKC65_11585 [Pyrinomonadaceae bacterium]|nr:hypothetical protein [Pyrinomonadaceae bacterium]
MSIASVGLSAAFLICLIFVNSGLAQSKKLEKFCQEAGKAFLADEWNGKLLRDDLFSSDCTIEVKLADNRDIYLSIEQYGSVREARKELENDLSYLLLGQSMASSTPQPRLKVKLDRWWSYGTAYGGVGSTILLQRKVFYILVIAPDKKDLTPIEKMLRQVGKDVGI